MPIRGREFVFIKPPEFQDKAMALEVVNSAKKWAPFAVKAFDRVTTGWKGERPAWVWEYVESGKSFKIRVKVKDPKSKGALKFRYLDRGTRPHKIVPKNAKMLVFPAGYRAGSLPGSLRTFGSESFGEPVFTQEVDHPGIKPRGWTDQLKKDLQKEFLNWMRPAMHRAARASRHGVR